jgi:hypothetical protein
MVPFHFAIEQISIAPLLRLLERSPAKDFDERRKLNQFIGRGSIHLYPSGKLEFVFRKDGYCLFVSIRTGLLKRGGQGNSRIGPGANRATITRSLLTFRQVIFATLASRMALGSPSVEGAKGCTDSPLLTNDPIV